MHAKSLSCVLLFGTPWTVVYQAPLSMGFSRQEYWSGLLSPPPGIFPTQELNLSLLRSRQILYALSFLGIPSTLNFAFYVEARKKEFRPYLEAFVVVVFLRVNLSGHLKGLCVGGSSSNHNDCL